MTLSPEVQEINTVVVGGGQAGLSVGYQLKRRNIPYVILDANERPGDSWRKRWDSLRVFTQNRFNGLPGMKFPGSKLTRPSKDEVADYLESYAEHFQLPVRTGSRVTSVTKLDGHYLVATAQGCFKAENIVVAMSNYQVPYVPAFANELNSSIVQLHSTAYRNPSQIQDGDVLVVGASDSGCEIALELSPKHRTTLAGRHPGHVPFKIDTPFGRFIGVPLVIGFLFHHVLSVSTPIGRRARKKMLGSTGPNVRVKPNDIKNAGIDRVGRVVGVEGGLPVLEDGRRLDVKNVVWCTGFRPDFSWIKVPALAGSADLKEPPHIRGVIDSEPGLFFVGLFFTRALSSSILRGVGRDAEYVADAVAVRARRD